MSLKQTKICSNRRNKMRPKNQSFLVNLIEIGIVTKTKHGKQNQINQKQME
jgi:hypothetical protein